MNNNELKFALASVFDEDIMEYSKMEANDTHVFSQNYQKRKQQILEKCSGNKESYVYIPKHNVGTMSRRRRLLMVVAVLVMVMAISAVAIAIIKPHIYYVIKETVMSWDVSFEQEKAEEESGQKTEQFACIKPKTPEGYSIVSEEKKSEKYSVVYKDDEDNSIIYYQQYMPEINMSALDSERYKIIKEKIGETEVMIGISDEGVISICNDGNYVYSIDGACDVKIIKMMMKDILANNEHQRSNATMRNKDSVHIGQ